MNLIVCVDDGHGMSFFGKRQSMDSLLREKALVLTEGALLWMTAYSAKQFSGYSSRIGVAPEGTEAVPRDAWYFLELEDPQPLLEKAGKVAVFHWNRHYPSDKKFPMQWLRSHGALVCREDFPGNSHDKITLEVYRL